jgi:hypothetical protein
MRSRFVSVAFLVAIITLAAAVPAAAQIPTAPPATQPEEDPGERRTSISFGYAYFRDGSWAETLRFGFISTLSHRLTRNFALVAEFGGSHGEYRNTGFSIQRYALLGGIKLIGGEGQIRPFFLGMAGGTRQGGEVGLANGVVVQGGGGAEFVFSERWSVLGQADYRVWYENREIYTGYRVAGHFAWHFGPGRVR